MSSPEEAVTQGALALSDKAIRVLWAFAILAGGAAIGRIIAAVVGRAVAIRGSRQSAMVAKRVVFYSALLIALILALRHAGVDPGVLLGTAGILTVALGFASQTSASNLISGIFLLFERPFVVGDIIRVGVITGEVLSVDMLSVKLRTFDNLYIRVPNETLLKSEIANISHFPIRRVDVKLAVGYGEDMEAFREALFDIAAQNPYVLDEPTPMVIVDEFRESTVAVQFSAWAERPRFLEAKNSLFEDIQERIYDGRFRSPYPVRVMVQADAARGDEPVSDPDEPGR